MRVELQKISKRFNKEWIFRDVDLQLDKNSKTAVLGPNGSGKSTLLQIISGILSPSSGTLIFSSEEKMIPVENAYRHLAIAAPYLELPEEMTLSELIAFHFAFKDPDQRTSREEIVDLLGFGQSAHKEIRHFSSGMKQRLKLALSLCSKASLVLLDEPTSNLDQQGIEWYHSLIERFTEGKTVLVCSNQAHEYSFCNNTLLISSYK